MLRVVNKNPITLYAVQYKGTLRNIRKISKLLKLIDENYYILKNKDGKYYIRNDDFSYDTYWGIVLNIGDYIIYDPEESYGYELDTVTKELFHYKYNVIKENIKLT